MLEINYIPLQAALSGVYDLIEEELLDEDIVTEWASKAMRKMSVKMILEPMTAFLVVSNHTAQLPCGLKFIDQIYYKETLDNTDITEIKLYTSDAESNTISHKVWDFTNSNYYQNQWKPLRLATSTAFHLGIHCQNAINIYTKCEHEYSITKNFTIRTSFKDGFLAVTYFSHPTNSEGDFLIPDNIEFIQAVEYYCIMKMWEKRMNQKEEGAANMFQTYKRLWTIESKHFEGNAFFPNGVDGYQNLQEQWLRIGQHNNQYYSGFGNLSKGEFINFSSYQR